MSSASSTPEDEDTIPQSSEDLAPASHSDRECPGGDIPINTPEEGTADQIVAFRLGRASWRAWTIARPLAVTNHPYYQQQVRPLRLFFDAALGRLVAPERSIPLRRELSGHFDGWETDLDSEPRNEQLAEFREALRHIGSYVPGSQLSQLIDDLDLSASNRFRESVRSLMEQFLPSDGLRRCYALGEVVEQGLLPSRPVEINFAFRRFGTPASSPPAPNAPAADSSSSLVEVEPILPGELEPDPHWRGILENRVHDVGLSIPVQLLDGIVAPQPDPAEFSPPSTPSTEHQPPDSPNPIRSRRSTGPSLDPGSLEREAVRQCRRRSFEALIRLLEEGLASQPGGSSGDASDRESSPDVRLPEGPSIAEEEPHTAARGGTPRAEWHHDHEPDSSSKFRYQVGDILTMADLRRALNLSDHSVRARARQGRIWVMKLGQNRYRLWVLSETVADDARVRLDPSSRQS